jgi:mannose-6-phosphate isomerase-like protein (cupin superfamily)
MSCTADVAQDQVTRPAGKAETGKGVTQVASGGGIRSLQVFGELLTYKVPSHKTGGAYSLFEATTQPGAGPPPHVNHREDESFYVLEGEYEFLIEGGTVRVGEGSLLYFPKGTLHAHRSVGEGAGRMLVTQTPGGLYERFFEEAGKAVDGDGGSVVFGERADVKRIVALAAQYGIEIPPLAEEA